MAQHVLHVHIRAGRDYTAKWLHVQLSQTLADMLSIAQLSPGRRLFANLADEAVASCVEAARDEARAQLDVAMCRGSTILHLTDYGLETLPRVRAPLVVGIRRELARGAGQKGRVSRSRCGCITKYKV